jgi:hypothetical protein
MSTILSTVPEFDLGDPTTCILDLANPKPKEVAALHDAFGTAQRAGTPLGPLPVKEGWNDITPAIAANLLMRNPPGANRWLNPAKVFYYATQMAADDWKPTGQPILIDEDDTLADAAHRLYAVLISGKTVRMYVVTGIEKGLFPYIDNGSARTAKDALQTAGYDGVASVIVNIIKFAEKVKSGAFNHATRNRRTANFSPADILRLAPTYPNAKDAARSATSDWSDATALLYGRKDIVAYVGMRIIDEHDEDVADEFFEAIMFEGDGATEYSVALHREMARDARGAEQMERHDMASMLIKLFNAWHRAESLGRRWMPTVTEDFAVIDTATPRAAAAE